MSPKQQNFVVGVFVMVGFAVLGGLIIVFGGGKTLLASTYQIRADFPNGVTGVQGGQSVTLNGKRIGETRDVLFADPKHLELGVNVAITIEGYDLPAGSELVIAPPAMGLGRPMIELDVVDPKNTQLLAKDGTAHVPGKMRPAIDQLVPKQMQDSLVHAATHIGDLAAAMKPVADNLSHLLEKRDVKDVDAQKMAANMSTLMQRFDDTLKNVNEIIGGEANKQNFKEILANAKVMSESGVVTMKNISKASEHSEELLVDTTSLLRRLTTLAEDMSSVMKRLDTVALAFNQKSGTVGLMLNDNRLYEEMLLTMRRLSKLLDEFREVADKANRGELRIKAF
jgi:ABC-type transporter Mla subunit MlaD